jgi:hypothetical protein
MTIEGASGTIRFTFRIDVQHDARDFLPIGTFRICVEHAQIGDEVFFVVTRQQYGDRAAAVSWAVHSQFVVSRSRFLWRMIGITKWRVKPVKYVR